MPVTFLCTALAATALLGADPETLPAPREAIVVPAPMTSYYRRSRYDVWQLYSPGRQGEWLPRVDYVPGDGYYYMYNGKPYLYASMYQTSVRPSIQGTPYRSAPSMPIEVMVPAAVVVPKPLLAAAPERMPYCED